MKLTVEENAVLDHLVNAWNAFVALPDLHPSDHEDFCREIHILQRHVMARLARRSDKDRFPASFKE